ncbi:hypothetical protein AN639_12800 [Candidatus Epulonipiscium fishelsonii]|uniref:Uncharacterized protein n=1 Tax=Candidatus Epulonipiscium fishelsonii TaxID=77094 RepID=A0ACC8X7J1_9FIRM|nr:hypothetical protein AN396_12620 [Epulopiscium sp. SCG-B11WGA-EpuloA1]ONI42208.1 hypothetical protein AN639_12800 [Epulopiscium sp. SCG-B05WGA-EpuloA1]ONI47693.1 hypothetical protein AN643_04085 [Epulopiscium sp. SCG-B10WGA-EpuloB]
MKNNKKEGIILKKENSRIEETLKDLEEINVDTERKLQKYFEDRYIPNSIEIFKKFNIHFYFSEKDKDKNYVYIKFSKDLILKFSMTDRSFKEIHGKNDLVFLDFQKTKYYCFETWIDALSYIHQDIDNYNTYIINNEDKECENITIPYMFPNIIILNDMQNTKQLDKFIRKTSIQYEKKIEKAHLIDLYTEEMFYEELCQPPLFRLCFNGDAIGTNITNLIKEEHKYTSSAARVKDCRPKLLEASRPYAFTRTNILFYNKFRTFSEAYRERKRAISFLRSLNAIKEKKDLEDVIIKEIEDTIIEEKDLEDFIKEDTEDYGYDF